jgi:spore germination protein
MYSYDWSIQGNTFKGTAYSPQEAVKRAVLHQSPIRYDNKSKAPTFTYYDEKGIKHVVWFEDARSVVPKFHLVKEFGLRGLGGWKLGLPFPQGERIKANLFKTRRY